MSLKCGIVGLPNVGKSTLFNALTRAGVAAENYPFCTIEPNSGVVEVPDPRLTVLSEIVAPERVVPAITEFVDIAGLVAGASKGEGLGNQFLAHIRETDAIAHVVRCFDDSNIIHVAGRISPLDDIEVIHTELALADLNTVQKALIRTQKTARSGDKDALSLQKLLIQVESQLDRGIPVRAMKLEQEQLNQLSPLCLLTAKPTLYVANVLENGFKNNPYLEDLMRKALEEGAPVTVVCASIEAQLSELSEADQFLFLEDMGLKEPGLNRLIRSVYALLGLETYFTAGVKEVRAWTIPAGSLAPKAAAVIHNDFERGFIRAEVISYEDFVQCRGEQGAKEQGKLRVEGRDYSVRDGDVMHFRFNV